ncbi:MULTISPECIES: CDP-alcohol phosphatidyltransferase family protein [unclassified Bradyrhizobium]|uniref:CDP-alcohol phosphatidyltransferase family protein n=1 Tax=unclassified Bradyrhizobium TaxID=2631580 RepID=UPI0028E6D721|nr:MULTISPECIES: CDP-alcohol phosphatidyltransferase family protein [unclassified Bradyrhizobium]
MAGPFIVRLNQADAITLCGLTFTLASLYAMLEHQFDLSVGLLLTASALDFVDGPVARALQISRNFGRYLDGFVDQLLYLVAPALFLYLHGFTSTPELILIGLFVSSGVVRLSVFNEIGNIPDDIGNSAYLGMPVFWSAFMLMGLQMASWWIPVASLFGVIFVLIASYTVAMVYRRRFYKFQRWQAVSLTLLGAAVLFFVRASI